MEFPTYNSGIEELEKIESILDKFCPEKPNLLSRQIGIYKIFKNILSNLKFLNHINNGECATQPFATLSRMIIDNYSILYLISTYSSIKERDLRYYLYLMDSLEGRINLIEGFSKTVQNNSLIKDFQPSKHVIDHDKRAIKNLMAKIKTDQLDEIVSVRVIDKRNWKFDNDNHKQKERLSWEDLYIIARIPKRFSKIVQNHYSTYTHGLGMTILYEPRNESFVESTFLLLSLLNLNIARILIDEFNLKPDKMDIDPQFVKFVNHQWENYQKWDN
ncbi:hypothetical protein [Salinimicrobium sp. HB62]|uniref:hypothetical protein n=1 Tax=Salinimicrobium sp. HB62 TaxID=3077781 RepID=UPI002D78C40E|nr:hypothetical protein [Salinimicrobium sp. HB62]